MDHPLYFTDCYCKEFTTQVISVKDSKYVVLKDTAFYPSGGRQPHDVGKLIRLSDGKVFPVVFVGKFEGTISHEIIPQENDTLKEGDTVQGSIDWERRYKLMRMHTSAHILDYIFMKNNPLVKVTGNQLEVEKSRIDFNVKDFDKTQLPLYIEEANDLIQKEVPVHIKVLPREKVILHQDMIKLEKGFDENIKEVRLLEIEGYDTQPCGGTHVKNTREIGKITFLKFENKGAENKRLYFNVEP